ncbi:WAP four-disulfide core domain protein 3 [Pseudophryne corroboree]|uniref:WAP four-disulfide core domain protein 3 n=1 Tax=Pseudophryne corroboree TaxID=495146 RepID=UPI003081DD94
MKCCLDNCQKMCKPPAQERPGACPVFTAHAGKCSDNCTSDSECPGHAKCCFKTCGKTCVPTLTDLAKPNMEPIIQRGFCPQENILNCALPERATCDDFSCVDGYKCCPMICRRECRKAVDERVGNCPAADTACPTGTENTSCQSDYDCQILHKCCSTKCGKKCVRSENDPPILHY